MIKINRIQKSEFVIYEALFIGGNLYAFTMFDLLKQLLEIYGFKISLFQFSLN